MKDRYMAYNPETQLTSNYSSLSHWYMCPENNVHESLMAVIRYIDSNQQYRQQINARSMRLYGNLDQGYSGFLMFTDFTKMSSGRTSSLRTPRVALNVIKSCIDTIVSKFAKDKIKPTFLTSGGDWALQQQAKRLEKFVAGVFYEGDVYTVEQRSLLNTCVFGTGFVKTYPDVNEGKICFEEVMTDEVQIDELDGYYKKPRNMYQRRFVDRGHLCAVYPDLADKIQHATKSYGNTTTALADLILVVEGWHLPSAANKKDGRHVLAVDTCTLIDEPWTRDHFPIAANRWSELPVGYFGQSVVDELLGIQIEINRLLFHIQESMRLMSSPKMLVANGTNVVTSHLNNEIAGIIKYTGQAPQVIAPSVVAPEVFQQLQNLYSKAYEIVGVSQLSANSQKPQGLDSGRALREFNDIQTERFVLQGRKREEMFITLAENAIQEARYLSKKSRSFEVKTHSKLGGVEIIKWSDIDISKDDYVMQIFPTSALPSSPAFRVQTIQELIQGGLISPEYATDLLDFPDLEAYSSLANADLNNIKRVLNNIIEKSEYEQPEPFENLQLAQKLGQQHYNKGKIDGLPEDRLALIRRYLSDIDTWMAKAQQAQQAQQQAQAPLPTQTLAPGLQAA